VVFVGPEDTSTVLSESPPISSDLGLEQQLRQIIERTARELAVAIRGVKS
jgi:hypothetical protein